MFRNYLAAAFRNLARNRLHSGLNILGLSVGLAAALLALLYLRFELSWDRFIPSHGRVHLVSMEMISKVGGRGASVTADSSPVYFAGWLHLDYPDLQVTRLGHSTQSVRRGDFETMEVLGWGDPNFFSLLALPAIAGDPAAALARPDAVVLTRRMARKYFGRDVPLGETLQLDRRHTVTVAAVIEDLPAATHLAPEFYLSSRHELSPLARADAQPYRQGTVNLGAQTYVAPPPGTDGAARIAALQADLPDFIMRHMQVVVTTTIDVKATLVALPDIHLRPINLVTMKPHGSRAALAAVGGAALLILIVVTINFVNLMTARSARRAIEVGVRKVSGAEIHHLVLQFMGEGLIYAAAASAIALALVESVLPTVDGALVPGIAAAGIDAAGLAGLLAIAATIGLLGGVYPALIMSGFPAARVLKGVMPTSGSGLVREGLVVLQFGLLIGLILATLVMYRQTMFGLRDGLRMAHDQVLLVYGRCQGAFLDELRGLPGVEAAACSSSQPLGSGMGGTNLKRPDGTAVAVQTAAVGFGFFELYGLQPLAGRVFEEGRAGDGTGTAYNHLAGTTVVLNESAVRMLGFASPASAIGQRLQEDGSEPSEVIGVVPDFALDLMSREIVGQLYFIAPPAHQVYNIKLGARAMPETLDAIDALWRRVGEPRPINRVFLDRRLQDIYAGVIRQSQLIAGLSAVAIFIACLGLFGLSVFTAERRTREIGIRKAMGAGVAEILRLLLWQFARPVLWANLIAWPIAFWAMTRWLQGFAYRIELQPWMFVAAAAMALLIALATVAGHSLLVARTRPMLALRYE